MNKQSKISLTVNRKDKQNTYMRLLSRYKLAIKHEFYFEALLIVYAFLEDRLFSYLYYIGAIERHDSKRYSKRTKQHLINIITQITGKDKNNLSISRIGDKMLIAESTLKWADDVTTTDNDYYTVLKHALLGIDIGGMIEVLEKIKVWLNYRNEIVHAAMKKNFDDMHNKLEKIVSDGMEYGRYIDSQVKVLKKSNIIRRKMKMGNQ